MKRPLPLALVFALSGCAGGVAAGLGGAALVPVIASTVGVSATTLTDIAAAGCAAQAAANVAGKIAADQGSAAWAAHFAEASAIAGYACVW